MALALIQLPQALRAAPNPATIPASPAAAVQGDSVGQAVQAQSADTTFMGGSQPSSVLSVSIGRLQQATTPDDFAALDALAEPDLSIVYPGLYDSVLQDRGGWRSKLAKYDISVIVRNTTIVSYDGLQNNRPASPQAYNGQKFTLISGGTFISVAAGLNRFGLGNAKFLFSAIYLPTTWAPNGPTKAGIRELGIYDSFANGKVSIKAGK